MSEDLTCQAKTSDGDSCNNKAIYPKDNPIACHLKSHQRQLEVVVDEPKEEEDMPKEKGMEEPKPHIFASKSLHHTVFVDTDKEVEDGERDFFRAEFNAGRYETYDDKKAKLLDKQIEKIPALKRRIKKIQ